MDINNNNFNKEVIEEKLPVLVDFWAVWCGPCLRLAPIIEEIKKNFQGRLKVCKVNINESPDLADIYEIKNIPVLIIFKGGKIAGRIIGAPSIIELSRDIEKLIGE